MTKTTPFQFCSNWKVNLLMDNFDAGLVHLVSWTFDSFAWEHYYIKIIWRRMGLPIKLNHSFQTNITIFQGCRHSSVDSFAPSIMPPWFWLPSMPSMLFQYSQICAIFVLAMWEKNKNKQKRGRVWPIFFKKITIFASNK